MEESTHSFDTLKDKTFHPNQDPEDAIFVGKLNRKVELSSVDLLIDHVLDSLV